MAEPLTLIVYLVILIIVIYLIWLVLGIAKFPVEIRNILLVLVVLAAVLWFVHILGLL